MARNVALSEKAYNMLRRLKGEKESFSDVVVRLSTPSGGSLLPVVGLWKDDTEAERIYRRILRDRHASKPHWVDV
ncbi:MAG: antitoxin VapB family protein [Candidatus Aenigmarchaeota archaeon]|nr:antitoxin VapB family protein [Candidatus Aenigmarchaeota archaeon]